MGSTTSSLLLRPLTAAPITPENRSSTGLRYTFELRKLPLHAAQASSRTGSASWVYECRNEASDQCWAEHTGRMLTLLSGHMDLKGRCDLRYATLDAAQAACTASELCEGVTQDSGIRCMQK